MASGIPSAPKFAPLPIKTRLSVAVAGFFAICILALSVGEYFAFRGFLERDAERLATERFEAVRADLDRMDFRDKENDLTEMSVVSIDQATNLGLLVFVFDAEGQALLSPSPLDIPITASGAFRISTDSDTFVVYGGKTKNASLFVALSEEQNVSTKLRQFFRSLIAVDAGAILLVFAGSYLFARRALRPLDRLKAYISGDPAAADEEFPVDEIGFVAEEFGRYKGRVEAAAAREREFSADASHELRTPLTVLRTSIELLDSPQNPPSARNRLAVMLGAVEDMEGIVKGLLLVDRGLANGEEIPVGIGAFLEGMVRNFSSVAEKKGLELRFELVEDIELKTGRERLDRVFGNLLRNALTYTERGSVTVTVAGAAVRIADTGPGIARADLSKIWKRSFRAGEKRSHEGSGLGLAIVKRLAEEAGWRVGVESEVGKGSVFTVRFR